MKFFKKYRRSKKQKAQQDATAAPSTPSTKYRNNTGNPRTDTNEGIEKKIKSPLKKIKGFFRKKKVPEQKYLTLLSPEVHNAEASKYYSNNTDGFEVILEGRNLQYEENPNIEPPRKDPIICGVQMACAPLSVLSDWDYFVSILSGNFNLFGEEENNQIADYENSREPPLFEEIVTNSKNRDEDLPYDEQVGAQERLTIETTLEQHNQSEDEFSTATSGEAQMRDAPSASAETIEIHPFKKKNDGPISNILRNNMRPIENDLLEQQTETADYVEPDKEIEFPSFEQPEEDVPDEEIYDTSFTLKFLKEASNIGIILTYFHVPEDGQEMSSRVVNLTIKPGFARGSRLLEPKLCWQDMQNKRGPVTSISLLGIHSIQTTLNPDEDDNPFFTVTANNGEVHAFESPTLSERNYIVHGIKNVVAWLSYHLVTGNMAKENKLAANFDEERGETGELPSLKTPVQAINDMSHAFLDF